MLTNATTLAFAKKHAADLSELFDGYANLDDTGKAAARKEIAVLTDRLAIFATGHRLHLDTRTFKGGVPIGSIPS